ncbi:diguanylate cyclase, partial [bacterium]|nr:diguanylate cyclase [bacterium]
MGKLFLLLASVVLAVLAVYATTNGNVALAVVAIAVLCVQGLAWLLVSFSQRRHHFSSAARRDVMTGLPNRAAGREAIEATLSQQSNGQHYAVTLIKLSNMRELAAMYGTEVVEVILLEAGRRLQTLSGLTTLASLGGSQFLLLVERNKNHDIDAIAQQVMHSFDAPFSVNAVDMTAECHIGFALSPEHGVTYSDLMRRASLALSNCANEAKPYAIYVDGQDEIYFRQLQVAGRLQHAIANNGFEIRLQPQLVLPAQRIVAAELLLSWVDTEMGRMSPEEFIPLAERSGDITAITRWVLL